LDGAKPRPWPITRGVGFTAGHDLASCRFDAFKALLVHIRQIVISWGSSATA
jgi:hypothetical protein